MDTTQVREEISREYNKLPEAFRSQLRLINKQFESSRRVQDTYTELKRRYGARAHFIELFIIAIFRTFRAPEMMEDNWLNQLSCYAPTWAGDEKRPSSVQLVKTLKNGKRVRVIEGRLCFPGNNKRCNMPVVVKWYQSDKRDITHEMGMYTRLKELGCDIPWFSQRFCFWQEPVLVIEKLEALSLDDDENELGVDVIRQLKFIHRFGVHCDLKPGNIMKKTQAGRKKFYVIDYGGVATTPLRDGYARWLWTPRWTSQKKHEKNQVTYPKNDLIELGYTMRDMQIDHDHGRAVKDKDPRSGFHGRLKKFMKKLESTPNYPTEKDYDSLISILSKK